MGWQLWPLGVGWREISTTPFNGQFTCPNPRCKSLGATAAYDHKSGRNWFTLLFVPVIPLNKTGEWIKCKKCKSLFPLTVLAKTDKSTPSRATRPVVEDPPPPAPPRPSSAPTPPVLPVPSHAASAPEPAPSADQAPEIGIQFEGGESLVGFTQLLIGRAPELVRQFPDAAVRAVDDPTVSKSHLVVGIEAGCLWIYDNHSSNGVFVRLPGGELSRVVEGRKITLPVGTTVSIGDTTSFTVEELSS